MTPRVQGPVASKAVAMTPLEDAKAKPLLQPTWLAYCAPFPCQRQAVHCRAATLASIHAKETGAVIYRYLQARHMQRQQWCKMLIPVVGWIGVPIFAANLGVYAGNQHACRKFLRRALGEPTLRALVNSYDLSGEHALRMEGSRTNSEALLKKHGVDPTVFTFLADRRAARNVNRILYRPDQVDLPGHAVGSEARNAKAASGPGASGLP